MQLRFVAPPPSSAINVASLSHLRRRCRRETRSIFTCPMISVAVDTVDAVPHTYHPTQLSLPHPDRVDTVSYPYLHTVDLYYHKDRFADN
jgi:hypothetical protein